MFNRMSRVYIALSAGTVPGVTVADPEPTTYTNRRGVAVRTMQVPVISRREWNGRTWHQLSLEVVTLLSARETIEPDLDVTAEGEPIPLPALWAKQRESLQEYLARRQAPAQTPTRRRSKAAATA